MNDDNRAYNVLFLCTGNSARSILAEVLLNSRGAGRFRAFSAGSHPVGRVNPYAMAFLQKAGHATDGLRSKSWDEFAAPGSPALDFVFTVCDSAANEVCPIWPGHPATTHWGIADPAHVEPLAARQAAFKTAYVELEKRITAFLKLPLETLSTAAIIDAARKIHSEATP